MFPRLQKFLLLAAALPALGLLLATSGCDQGGTNVVVSETDEKQYQYAQQMLREDHPDEALAAFLRVIRKRQGDAPESNLEAGRILLTVKKDPFAAGYHFREYLAEKPDSEQAPMVKELLETAKKDFARTLPGQPYSNQYDRVDLLEQIKQLRAENDNLRRQTATAVQPASVTAVTLDSMPVSSSSGGPARGMPTLAPRSQTLSQPAIEAAPAPPPPVRAAPVAATRTYVVVEKDTLSVISLKFYGTRNRYMDIFNANRDQLNTINTTLHPGMVLKIPQ